MLSLISRFIVISHQSHSVWIIQFILADGFSLNLIISQFPGVTVTCIDGSSDNGRRITITNFVECRCITHIRGTRFNFGGNRLIEIIRGGSGSDQQDGVCFNYTGSTGIDTTQTSITAIKFVQSMRGDDRGADRSNG